MKIHFAVICLIIFSAASAQEKLSRADIYKVNDIVHSKVDDKPLTGTVAFIKKNKHTVFEKYYENGYLKKYTEYFNGDGQRIAEEVFYFPNSNIEQKKVKHNLTSTIFWITDYDERGEKVLYQIIENNKITYKCGYLNGKKDGTEICEDENGNVLTQKFEKGKLIK
ncbi:toxin-antitoxin system YwqK family antitoxin [Flavobacterium selenitireducens]|uniref:hypothetical protein n=1 Tax=Flavobacterium selenitireducens TaxID=2722704 RepID=UPI00168AC877|nr:hypothetical protein [Flavobacterium selenitireducens]MBD3584044.1 hypothetical protein [Flavobacterium selenitireducens]